MSKDDDERRLLEEAKEELSGGEEKVKEFRKLVSQVASAQQEVKESSERLRKLLSELNKAKRKSTEAQVKVLEQGLEKLQEVGSETHTLFSRLIVGNINLKLFTTEDKLQLRNEYDKFKVRTAVIYLTFPLLVLFQHFYLRYLWTDTHWINVFYQLWLLYFYISLALRENMLLVNGSNIRTWWLYHHYLAAMATVVLLVWPATDKYEGYVPYFTTFACYNGFVQNLQNVYHKRREYANRALGNIQHMDITYQETITEFPKELLLLLPFLMIAHLWELVLGFMLLDTFFFHCDLNRLYWTEYREELQILASAVLQLVMGIGNLVTTIQTLRAKTRRHKKQG